ncbi:hypothetical protein GIB67_034177 [Kingdonia uniflora]|uniref:Uncharacterized protein n=1 Tax=Kingdonia uniflora TaxID=39325 RepID=A0A7J7NRG6_9MAGN|nr:hypothetical protein GIB67_034177 [Kingdonia uniflora]
MLNGSAPIRYENVPRQVQVLHILEGYGGIEVIAINPFGTGLDSFAQKINAMNVGDAKECASMRKKKPHSDNHRTTIVPLNKWFIFPDMLYVAATAFGYVSNDHFMALEPIKNCPLPKLHPSWAAYYRDNVGHLGHEVGSRIHLFYDLEEVEEAMTMLIGVDSFLQFFPRLYFKHLISNIHNVEASGSYGFCVVALSLSQGANLAKTDAHPLDEEGNLKVVCIGLVAIVNNYFVAIDLKYPMCPLPPIIAGWKKVCDCDTQSNLVESDLVAMAEGLNATDPAQVLAPHVGGPSVNPRPLNTRMRLDQLEEKMQALGGIIDQVMTLEERLDSFSDDQAHMGERLVTLEGVVEGNMVTLLDQVAELSSKSQSSSQSQQRTGSSNNYNKGKNGGYQARSGGDQGHGQNKSGGASTGGASSSNSGREYYRPRNNGGASSSSRFQGRPGNLKYFLSGGNHKAYQCPQKTTLNALMALHGWGTHEFPRRVLDAVLFSKEVDILTIGWNELYPYITQFVLLESNSTFIGLLKHLVFAGHRDQFKFIDPRLTYGTIGGRFKKGDYPFAEDAYQRVALHQLLKIVETCFTHLKSLDIKGRYLLDEHVVHVGVDVIVCMLRNSFFSKLPLTEVLLSNHASKTPPALKFMSSNITESKAKHKDTASVETTNIVLKLTISKEKNKIILLAFPLGSVVKLLDQTPLGCLSNLYQTVEGHNLAEHMRTDRKALRLLEASLTSKSALTIAFFNFNNIDIKKPKHEK